ncbi:MAG: hypothetical protein AAGB32_03110 [Pseudomonadota bacterium]
MSIFETDEFERGSAHMEDVAKSYLAAGVHEGDIEDMLVDDEDYGDDADQAHEFATANNKAGVVENTDRTAGTWVPGKNL